MDRDFKLCIDFFEFEHLKSANGMSDDDVVHAIYDGAQEHIQDVLRKCSENGVLGHSRYKQLKRKRSIGNVTVYFMPTINTYTKTPTCVVFVKVLRPKKIKQYEFSCERIQQNLVDKMLIGELDD